MDSEIPEPFQKELTCLVFLNFLLDPVTTGCGHSFCRSCLCLFWEQAEASASCPVCRQRSEQTNLKTNFLLKNLVSAVRKANLRQFLKCEEQLCGTHKQTKTIFCEADKSLLCLVCSQGICKDSWIRKDDGILDESNRDKFLLLCVKRDDHYQLWTTAPTTPLYIERPLGRVGVFLDCDSGSISFVDVAKHSLLWRYDDGVCTFPFRPFICTGHR
ncbi:unnamed protein product [Rangifer tarandus platyrhynchus]|uniref:RING-type domain-containing protein n=1 Tax=Rangifer tarandus platyrhynchus TaxID=3082113 RepID=A0ABN8Z417_RANTA|nr:unnamed protein product [Rangifer tarandus platyrhynchus]